MLKLAPVFTDNMVLQRNAEVVIWGETQENLTVTGEICGEKSNAEIDNGRFELRFNKLKAGGPYELKIFSEKDSITLKNVLVGEVWIAGGQSNMEFQLKNTVDAADEISKADYPEIRYYYTPQIEYETETERIPDIEDKGWQISSSKTAGEFSAVAYHFAKNLYKDLKVPIGIVNCNKGGTSASCWISEEYLTKDQALKTEYLDTYNKSIEGITEEEEDKAIKEYHDTLEEYMKKEEEYKKKYPGRNLLQQNEDIGPFPWPPPIGKKNYRRPNGLYNTMFKKIVPYTAKGIIWYQGEEDATIKPKLYRSLFSKVINNWREELKNPEIPFVFVQLPMFDEQQSDNWAVVRDAQLYTVKNVPNTSMVVTADCGEKDNIHPTNKKPVGERLALVVRQDIYKENINGHSPLYNGCKTVGDKIEVTFDYVSEDDLHTTDGDEIKGFEVSGKDGKFYHAKALAVKDKVIVWNETVKAPTAVRYGWRNYIELNLVSKNGLPVSPFNSESEY